MSWVDALVSWLLTYAVHSTVVLGGTALLTRLVRDYRWKEILWRAAVLGPVVTASFTLVGPFESLGGTLSLPGYKPATEASATPGSTSELVDEAGTRPPSVPLSAEVPSARGPAFWTGLGLATWGGTAILLLGLLVGRNRALVRRLGIRRPISEGPVASALADLRRRSGTWRPIRLSVCDACPVPLVLGRAEICLPPAFLDSLDPEQQRAALAHELAHVRRRDPEWRLVLGLFHALLFFQPLNRLASKRLRETAEYLCDDWAVQQTGSRLALGRCLTDIASWATGDPSLRIGGTYAVAEGGSPLVDRIRRIVEGRALSSGRFVAPASAAAGLLIATGVILPDVGRPDVAANQRPDTVATVAVLETLALGDPSPRVRREAAAELSSFPHPAAEEALVRIVRRAQDPAVRAEAAQQLDEFPSASVVTALLGAIMEDPDSAVRHNSLDVLADFAGEDARSALGTVVRGHADETVRSAALAALAGGDNP